MQRPTRILIFGILCLVVGVFSGMKNTVEVAVAILGPEFVDKLVEQQQSQGIFEFNVESMQAERRALTKPVHRITQGIESLISAAMAGALIVGGVLLLCDRMWGFRLARYWAYYALVASSVTVVMQVRYVVPELSAVPEGGAIVMGVFMLAMLWVIPLLILLVLGRPVVTAYLRWIAQKRIATADAGYAMQSTPAPIQQQPFAPAEPADPPVASSAEPSVDTSVQPRVGVEPSPHTAQQTWRDDPWNDPSSK